MPEGIGGHGSGRTSVIRPPIPYSVAPHLFLFTIEGSPVPTISGEPWRAEIMVLGPVDLAIRLLRADFDYRRFLRSVQGYPKLRAMAKRYMGLRPTRSLSLYSALLESVIKQRKFVDSNVFLHVLRADPQVRGEG